MMRRVACVLFFGVAAVMAAEAAVPGGQLDGFKCWDNQTRYHHAHPRSCKLFIKCDFKRPFVFTCPGDLLWNNKIQTCDWPANVNCRVGSQGCDSNPCQNGGSCFDSGVGNSYRCQCRSGFSGQHCEVETSTICLQNPCQNKGTCSFINNEYKCQCAAGYTGRFCDDLVVGTKCATNNCRNGGTCHETGLSTVCRCLNNYAGDFCETTPCNKDPFLCQPGGTCYAAPGLTSAGYVCMCRDGNKSGGTNCSDVTTCQTNVCAPGGTCSFINGEIKCDCKPSHTGKYCQTPVDVTTCQTNVCAPGGTCSFINGEIKCDCKPSHTGKYCQTRVGTDYDCTPNLCVHGQCRLGGRFGFYCECDPGYVGKQCDTLAGDHCTSGNPFPCPADVIYYTYPDYDNPLCTTYYQCIRGTLVKRNCSDQQKFNAATLRCEQDDGSKTKFFCDRVKQVFQELKANGSLIHLHTQ